MTSLSLSSNPLSLWDDLDPDLPAEAGHLGGDLPDPGHGNGQALDKVGVDTHLKCGQA